MYIRHVHIEHTLHIHSNTHTHRGYSFTIKLYNSLDVGANSPAPELCQVVVSAAAEPDLATQMCTGPALAFSIVSPHLDTRLEKDPAWTAFAFCMLSSYSQPCYKQHLVTQRVSETQHILSRRQYHSYRCYGFRIQKLNSRAPSSGAKPTDIRSYPCLPGPQPCELKGTWSSFDLEGSRDGQRQQM